MAAAATQGRGELGSGQLAAPLGGWRQLEHRQGISGGQVGAEGLQRGRVEGPQADRRLLSWRWRLQMAD